MAAANWSCDGVCGTVTSEGTDRYVCCVFDCKLHTHNMNLH